MAQTLDSPNEQEVKHPSPVTTRNGMLLIPQPSDDLEDPLVRGPCLSFF